MQGVHYSAVPVVHIQKQLTYPLRRKCVGTCISAVIAVIFIKPSWQFSSLGLCTIHPGHFHMWPLSQHLTRISVLWVFPISAFTSVALQLVWVSVTLSGFDSDETVSASSCKGSMWAHGSILTTFWSCFLWVTCYVLLGYRQSLQSSSCSGGSSSCSPASTPSTSSQVSTAPTACHC